MRVAGREDDLKLPADESYGPLAEAALRMGLAPERLCGVSGNKWPFMLAPLFDCIASHDEHGCWQQSTQKRQMAGRCLSEQYLLISTEFL
jgi:hypothetical protein